jgi:hypothetical protein
VFERLFRRFRGDAHPVTEAWVARRLADTRLYSTLPADRVVLLRRSFPRRADAAIAAAERTVGHEFELLGSGPFAPVDPDRSARGGYTPIDWYLDPVRNLRFPRGVPHKEWKLYEMRPANADVKYPWELARCQHWAALGQAFALTGDERFAQEIAHELDDFVEANPIGIGINFTCTMDVAIRALNWAIGFELVHRSTTLDQRFWQRAYAALYDSGVFTRSHLENTYEVTSNHFLSNVVGLWFLGAVFADLPAGQEWQSFAREALEQEIKVQVLPDGADYESSVPYHRLVTELFMGSLRLGEFRGEPLSAGYRARVRDMVAFLAAVTRPDGLMPQAGDADDGRLHVFADYGKVTAQDGRHLFGPSGVIFDEPAWTALAGDVGEWEASWWGLEPPVLMGSTISGASRLFRDAGLAVMRAPGSHYVLASNGIVGTKGFGNHKHNDLLSFEYHPAGVPLVVDPGSYVYTSDFDARNRFRSTAAHNTVQVDGEEQNELKPEWIFRLFETSNAEHLAFSETAQCVEYTGRHHGYERFEHPVTHERTFRLVKQDGSMSVTDRLTGRGTHSLRWHFHLAPGVGADMAEAGTVLLSAAGRIWRLQLPPDLSPSICEAAYSPSYGVTLRCLAIDATTRVTLDGTTTWSFAFGP